MPLLGEPPITSYFQPIPASKKRKRNQTLNPVKKQRSEQNQPSTSNSKVVKENLILRDEEQAIASDIIQETRTRNKFLERSVRSSSTQFTIKEKATKSHFIPFTKKSSRRQRQTEREISPELLESCNRQNDFIVVPSTKVICEKASRVSSPDSELRNRTTQKSTSKFASLSAPFLYTDHLSGTTPKGPTFSSPQHKFCYARNSSLLVSQDSNFNGLGDENAFIASSQTQHLTIYSPTRSHIVSFGERNPQLAKRLFETIPSSQSQEEELTIGDNIANDYYISPNMSNQEELNLLNYTTIQPYLKDIEGAADVKGLDSQSISGRCTPDPAASKIVPREWHSLEETESSAEEILDIITHDSSTYESGTDLNITSRDNHDTYSESSSLDSASLPMAVKEFQLMFGSSDESYPPDFPSSLRF